MSTFQELQTKLSTAKFRKALLEYIVQHLDSDFRPSSSGVAKKKILTSDRLEVPQDTFETEVSFFLEDIQELDQEIATILEATLAPHASEQEEVPVQIFPEKTEKKKHKPDSKQGEIQ